MIKKIEVTNFKSIESLSIELGRFNVLIGENGSGKSNILEAIAFGGCALRGELKNEDLLLRGVRISDPKYFKSGFEKENTNEKIRITYHDYSDYRLDVDANIDDEPYAKWKVNALPNEIKTFKTDIAEYLKNYLTSLKKEDFESQGIIIDIENKDIKLKDPDKFSEIIFQSYISKNKERIESIIRSEAEILNSLDLTSYIVYAPENYFLRNLNTDQPFIAPLGCRGEGLFKLINIIKNDSPDEYNEIIEALHLIEWFDSMLIDEDSELSNGIKINLFDKYLEDGLKSFELKNANEGFLFLIFYLTLFISNYTPKFFAIENIDTAFNPKLCSKLISLLNMLSKKYNKQVLITTHNPSSLDGINIADEESRIYVISRNKIGRTKADRLLKKETIKGQESAKLSEQFLRGYIGGLPKNF